MEDARSILKKDIHRLKKSKDVSREDVDTMLEDVNTLAKYNAIDSDTIKYCYGELMLICKCRDLYCEDIEITLNLIG